MSQVSQSEAVVSSRFTARRKDTGKPEAEGGAFHPSPHARRAHLLTHEDGRARAAHVLGHMLPPLEAELA